MKLKYVPAYLLMMGREMALEIVGNSCNLARYTYIVKTPCKNHLWNKFHLSIFKKAYESKYLVRIEWSDKI